MTKDEYNQKLDQFINTISAVAKQFPMSYIEVVDRVDIRCTLRFNSMVFGSRLFHIWYDKDTGEAKYGEER